jgi:hypothetical protein
LTDENENGSWENDLYGVKMRNVGAFVGFKGIFGRWKNGFWRFEGMKMVKNVSLPRAYIDAVAGATRLNSAGPDFGHLAWASRSLFGWGVRIAFAL